MKEGKYQESIQSKLTTTAQFIKLYHLKYVRGGKADKDTCFYRIFHLPEFVDFVVKFQFNKMLVVYIFSYILK